VTILLLAASVVNAVVCMRNFGKGVRPYLQGTSQRAFKARPDDQVYMLDHGGSSVSAFPRTKNLTIE
jgi:hypothetical protein